MAWEDRNMAKQKFPATFLVHWPTGPTACCANHARALIRLGQMLGSHIAATKAPDDAECMNCINEAKADAASGVLGTGGSDGR